MHCRRLVLRYLLTISACSMIFSGCAGAKSAATAPGAPPAVPTAVTSQLPDDVVARVSGREITRSELDQGKKMMMAGRPKMQFPSLTPEELEKQALDQLIAAELLYQAGQKLEVRDLDQGVDAKLAQVKSRFKDEQAFAGELERAGTTEKMLREYTRRDLVIANFVEKLAADLEVGEEETLKYYDDNPDSFLQEEQVRVSHILIGVDAKASPEERDKAREKADQLKREISGGADFAGLAKANSACWSGKNGGDLGYIGKSAMVPAFEKAAFALKPKEVSGVVETEFGYHIVKLTDRITGKKVSFASAREKIEDTLRGEKINRAVVAFIGQARQEANIEYLLK